jgi:MFS family permease
MLGQDPAARPASWPAGLGTVTVIGRDEHTTPVPPTRELAYPALLALGSLDAAGYSVITPVLPAIAARTGAGPALMGALVASFPAGMLVGFALAGTLVRRQRRVALVLAALALVAVGCLGCLGFVVSDAVVGLFATRLVMGLGSGGLWIAVTFATLERWPGQEYLCMSRIYAAYSVGGLIGPALGALGGIRGPFLAYLALVLAAMPLAAVLGRPAQPRRFDADRSALRLPGFWLASAGILFVILALGLSEGVLPLHVAGQLGQPQIGALYVGVAVVVAAGSAAAGYLTPTRALAGAGVLIVTGITLAGAVSAVPAFVLALAATGAGIGVGQTGATGVLLDAVPLGRIVTAMVLWSQVGIVGYLAGPLLGGVVVQAFGFMAIGVVPLVGAVLLVVVACTGRARPTA